MTFIEAAADILEREGKPLHAKDIAEKAMALGLLSHVGKTPVQTMSAQLSAAVLKGTGPFSRVRPGIFALAKWQGRPPGHPRPSESLKDRRVVAAENEPRETSSKISISALVPALEKASAEHTAPAAGGVFPDAALQKRRKRRRKKTAKVPLSPVSANPSTLRPLIEGGDGARIGVSPLPVRPVAIEESHGTSTGEKTQAPSEKPKTALSNERFPDEIADLVEKVLRRTSHPLPAEKIVEELGMTAQNSVILIEALLTSDAFEREQCGQRPRFIKHKAGYALMDREVSGEIVTLENQAAEIKRRLAQLAERQVLKKLRSLPVQGFVRTMIVFLERSGFSAVKPAELPSLDGFHLSVQDRRRNGRFRTAAVLRQDPFDHVLSERAVMGLRGAMHHFDAMGGMIFTTGQVSEKAAAEGRIANLQPVAVVDGETLAGEMVRLGIGVKERAVRLPTYDEGFFIKIEL